MDRRTLLSTGLKATAALGVPSIFAAQTIDSHVHVWARKDSRAAAEYPFAHGANVPAALDASVEALLTRMRTNQVARTVLIQVIHYKWDNRYLLHCLRRYPEKFAGVCRVNPEDPDAPDTLSELTEQGCRGVRLSPAADASGDWIRGPLMPALWQRCAELRVPMTLLLPVSRLADVRPLIERNPHLTVVIDHMADCPVGDADSLKKLTAMAQFPRVFVKATHLWSLSKQPYPYADAQELVARVRDAFGSGRMMGGTDWPIRSELCDYAQRLALYRGSMTFLNAKEREDLLGRTAQRIWPK